LRNQHDAKKKMSFAYNDVGLQNLMNNNRGVEAIPFNMDAVGEGLGVKDDVTSFNSKDFTIRKNKSRKDIEFSINRGTSTVVAR
jgi:hypothetical protein